MYKVKPNVGMMFKFQFHYENGERVDLQKATNAIVEIRTVDSSSNITSSFADDFGYDLTNNCMWVRFSADAVVTVGNVVSANLTVQIRNTTGAYEYITTAAFVNLFVISNDDDASSVNGMIIDKPVKLSAAGLSITAHSPYINADGYWVYYSDDNKTWIVSTYKATNDVIVDKDSVTHLKDGAGNGSLVSTNDDKSSAGNTAIGLNCISLGSKNSNAGTSDVVLLGNGNRAKNSARNAVGVAGADVDANVAFAVGQGRTGDPGYPKNVFAVSPFGDISYRPSTDTDRLTNLQNTLNLGFINNLSYNKTSKKISYYVYTPNENFPSEHEQHTIDLSTLVSGDKTVTDTTYNSTTNEITVTYNDGTTSTFTLNEISTYVKSFVRTFQADSPVCFDAVTDQDGTTKTLFSPALFMKEPQTSLVLDNVYTGNSGGQTEYFKWFYDQYQITENTSSAINTFFNLPIDFATKPDCTPFDSSHVIVPTLSCMNEALANYLPLTGNASSATKATQDGSGNVITSTYATKNNVIQLGEDLTNKAIIGDRTSNLFNFRTLIGGNISEQEINLNWENYYTSPKIFLEAGKSYKIVGKTEVTNCRYFDDVSGYLGVANPSNNYQVTIPSNAVNPRIYVCVYTSERYNPIMLVESTIDTSKYIPYLTIDNNNVPELKYLTYNVTSKIPLSEGNYYIPSTARLAIPLSSRYLGQNITYCTASKEVVRLTLTSGCTTSGDIQIILDNAIFTIALDNSTDTTPALVAAKIASNTFPVWTVVYNAGDTYVQFQKNNIGANLSPRFFTGTTGAYGSITETTKGANEDWISETYIGSLLDDASWGNNANWKRDVSEVGLSQSKYIEGQRSANLFNKKGPFFVGAIQNTGLSSNATNFITTDKIYLTAGKTYRRYSKPNTPYSFATNCRYFDDNGYLGTMSVSDTDVTIPSNASNPYIYITLYANASVTGLSDYDQVMFLESTVDASKYIPYYTIDNIPIDYYKSCKNYGKSVGVFGGSLSVYAESDNAKNMWRNLLGMTVTNYGVPGAGFSSLQGTSVQQQVDGAGVHDIYILWCSTNDFGGNQQIGTYNDYSAADNYDNNKLVTQCGGINYAIKKLLEKNPLAEIYLFTSLKFFYSESGYNPFSTVTNTAGNTFKQYVDAQVECAKRFGIPVLDQFNLQGINEYNYTNYYNTDKLHMNANGYKKIGMVQVDFLSNGK